MARCIPPGGPRQFFGDQGFQFVEQHELGRVLVLLGDGDRNWRIIYTDGRPQGQPADVVASYYGSSVGRWEKDTLVVDSVGYNEKFWFMSGGLPHTEALHLTERFTRQDLHTEVRGHGRRRSNLHEAMDRRLDDAVGAGSGDSGIFLRGENVMKRSLIALALLLSVVPALAHHSFDAEYDANKVTNISGFVTKVDWQNPHAFVYVDVTEQGGAVKSFASRWGRRTRWSAAAGRKTPSRSATK